MAYFDCMGTCGVSPFKCKNHYCSGNPRYTPPKRKVKPKQGSGNHPVRSIRAKIRKDDGRGYNFFEDIARDE